MQRENRFTRFAVAALIGVFVSFMFANTVFVHSHKLADGSLVCHSHPYNPSGAHTHTTTILSLIASFNGVASSFTGVLAAGAAFGLVGFALVYYFISLYLSREICGAITLRAPPQF